MFGFDPFATTSFAGEIATASVSVTGVSAAGSLGTVTFQALANVTLTGVSAAGGIGTVDVFFPVSVSVTGVSATGSIGTVTIASKSNVTLTGGSSGLGRAHENLRVDIGARDRRIPLRPGRGADAPPVAKLRLSVRRV